MRLTSACLFTFYFLPCNGWVNFQFHSCQMTRLNSQAPTKGMMKFLKDKLADRNTNIKDDVTHAVADGALLDKIGQHNSDPEDPELIHPLLSEVRRITKPRAYPLFLAEKGTEIVEHLLFSKKSESVVNGVTARERVVVLGTGWGSTAFLKDIDTNLYDVTVVSPSNHFVFTPMLAGVCVGTVECRSICEPTREINKSVNFVEAIATEIDPKSKTVKCEGVLCTGDTCDLDEFSLQYDRLVMTVGAQTNTFGIPGVREHCFFLKKIEDARRIRGAIVQAFEQASLPNISDKDKRKYLTFVVIGAGPTGIEFASELRDFVEQDVPKYYPSLLKYVSIKVIEATTTVLAPFDKTLQQEAVKQMSNDVDIKDQNVRDSLPEDFKLIQLLLETSVKEVKKGSIELSDGTIVPYGLALWVAGNGPIPLTLGLVKSLGSEQAAEQAVARGRLAIDPWMRVIGGRGDIFALGDCSCITAGQLPATGQVAAQQGEYLAGIFNKQYNVSPTPSDDGIMPPPVRVPGVTKPSLSDSIASLAMKNGEYAKPFQFLNLGILAYTGQGTALNQITAIPNIEPIKGTGKLGNAVWKSVYLSKQVSWRNRLLVVNDWAKKQIFGRDITVI